MLKGSPLFEIGSPNIAIGKVGNFEFRPLARDVEVLTGEIKGEVYLNFVVRGSLVPGMGGSVVMIADFDFYAEPGHVYQFKATGHPRKPSVPIEIHLLDTTTGVTVWRHVWPNN